VCVCVWGGGDECLFIFEFSFVYNEICVRYLMTFWWIFVTGTLMIDFEMGKLVDVVLVYGSLLLWL
jgi:hypothetical protein